MPQKATWQAIDSPDTVMADMELHCMFDKLDFHDDSTCQFIQSLYSL